MCILSADRPLGPTDFACHACNNEECCHPDHLYAGTACTNMQDRFRRRRIRERRAARFYDEALLRIAEQPAHPWPLTPPKPKLPPAAERLRLVLDVSRDRQALNLSVMIGPTRKPFPALSASWRPERACSVHNDLRALSPPLMKRSAPGLDHPKKSSVPAKRAEGAG